MNRGIIKMDANLFSKEEVTIKKMNSRINRHKIISTTDK